MYLREMGSVELLSREGEIAIAKRIEAGRDMMIGGLCESPLTFRAIIAWHDALKAGRMLLRDIIDLEATQGGPAPNAADGIPVEEAPAPPPAFEAAGDDDDEEGEGGGGLSLSALEEKLKPEVLANFEEIEALYKKLHKMQSKRLETMTSGEEVNARLSRSACTTTASRSWSPSSSSSTSVSRAWKASCCAWPKAARSPATTSSPSTAAMSWTRTGLTASAA
jgi:RNA polymerase primary sigma factor